MGGHSKSRWGESDSRSTRHAWMIGIAGVILLLNTSPHAAERNDGDVPRASLICVTCHGIEGNSFKPNYPKLAGQANSYLFRQLLDFKEGRRRDPNMSMVAAGLSQEDMHIVADFFASRARPEKTSLPESEKIVIPNDKVSAMVTKCQVCHESGNMAPDRIPYIKGQQYHYLVKQLRDFSSGRRTDSGRVMAKIAATMADGDIDEVAQNIAKRQ